MPKPFQIKMVHKINFNCIEIFNRNFCNDRKVFILCLTVFCFLFEACKKDIEGFSSTPSSLKYSNGGPSDKINKIERTADGGFICCGNSSGDLFFDDGFLMKIDANGNREWYQKYSDKYNVHIWHAIQTSDGGYIACGSLQLDSTLTDYVIKTDANGVVEWKQSCFPPSYSLHLLHIIESPDHFYYAVGSKYENSSTANNVALIKLDAKGTTVYAKTYTDFLNYPPYIIRGTWREYGSGISFAADGSLLIAGLMSPSAASLFVSRYIKFLMNVDSDNGAVKFFYPHYDYLMEYNYLGNSRYYDKLTVKIVNLSNGYLLCSNYELPGNKLVMQLIKTDLSGNLVGEYEYEGLGNARLEDVRLMPDSSIVLAGASTSTPPNYAFPEFFPNLKCTILHLDKQLKLEKATYLGSDVNTNTVKCFKSETDGGWTMVGSSCNSNRGYDQLFWLRLDKNGKPQN